MTQVREPGSSDEPLGRITSISAGAGAVLVFFPSAALFFGHRVLASEPLIGLPTVAIFGILIMLGGLALVSTMFARLDLDCREEALALPPGSIRAVIAMALIVLFALMSVMLFNSLCSNTREIDHLSEAAKTKLVLEPSNHVTAVIPVPCAAQSASAAAAAASGASGAGASVRRAVQASAPASGASASDTSSNGAASAGEVCGPGDLFSYTVHLGNAAPSPAIEFAKQLLTLIGTLMTSVVSFYFAARSADATMRNTLKAATPTNPAAPAGSKKDDDADHEHGDVKNPTEDKDLPPATGGIAT